MIKPVDSTKREETLPRWGYVRFAYVCSDSDSPTLVKPFSYVSHPIDINLSGWNNFPDGEFISRLRSEKGEGNFLRNRLLKIETQSGPDVSDQLLDGIPKFARCG